MSNNFDSNVKSSNPGKTFRDYQRLISSRKVRKIVTPSGRGVRGNFPSRKAPKRLQFESLVEEAVLRVLEISTLPTIISTQPCVLELPGEPQSLRYTPDMQITVGQDKFFVEVKSDRFMRKQVEIARLREVISRLSIKGMRLILIVESDVHEDGLQKELKSLLRQLPSTGRYRSDLDPTLWDPLWLHEPSAELLQRWHEAQRVCDDLLRRVMRRDPGEFLAAVQQ